MLRIIGKIIKFVLPVVIILAGIHTTLTLIESKPQPRHVIILHLDDLA